MALRGGVLTGQFHIHAMKQMVTQLCIFPVPKLDDSLAVTSAPCYLPHWAGFLLYGNCAGAGA